MKKKEEQLQISLDRVKLQKHVYELCRVQKLTINEVTLIPQHFSLTLFIIS